MPLLQSELTTEVLLFSVDAIVGLIVLKSYNHISRFINSLQNVSAKGINSHLDDEPSSSPRYVMVRGSVAALGSHIPSFHVPNVNGVVQKLGTNEIVLKRNSTGIWWNSIHSIHQSFNSVPFAILVGNNPIEVQEVELADQLQLETVYNNYEPTKHSFVGSMISLLFGLRQCGVQTTEEMLREGTVITGIGDLVTLSDGSRILKPPGGNKPYYITTQPLSSLLQALQSEKTVLRTILIVTGGLAVLLGGMLASRLWAELKRRRELAEMKRMLKERRRAVEETNQDDQPESLLCLVCQDGVREVILLPCGHFCLCEQCSERISTTCPVCRRIIVSKAAVFL